MPLSDELLEQVVPDPLLVPVSHLVEGMRELRLWRCPDCKIPNNEEFLFSATISARTRRKDPQGCPRCSYYGPRVTKANRQTYQPYLDTLVKDSSNRGYLALVDEFPLKHNAHFQCAEGHIAYCSLEQMRKKDGCVTCYANKRKGTNLADVLFKHLHEEFLFAPAYRHLAPDFGMQDIPSGSSTIVVRWRCKVNPIHEWLAYPFRRTRDKRGCPFCGHKRLASGESLADLFREIAAEFDSDKNLSSKGQPMSPNTIWCRDRRKYWFLCPVGHSYQATIVTRTAHRKGCSLCEILPKSIFTLRPDLAAEWNSKKNDEEFPGVTAQTLTPGSNKKVWWVCSSKEKHEWLAMVKNRANGSGCPSCHGRPIEKGKTIAALYKYLVKSFNNGGNPKKAHNTKAVLRNKYFWQCQCGEIFERKLDDVIRRSRVCRNC